MITLGWFPIDNHTNPFVKIQCEITAQLDYSHILHLLNIVHSKSAACEDNSQFNYQTKLHFSGT